MEKPARLISLARGMDLPKAICAHQNYFLWGPREYTGEIMILVGSQHIEEARGHFAVSRGGGEVRQPVCDAARESADLAGARAEGDLQQSWAAAEELALSG